MKTAIRTFAENHLWLQLVANRLTPIRLGFILNNLFPDYTVI
jgi:hypothetical protein